MLYHAEQFLSALAVVTDASTGGPSQLRVAPRKTSQPIPVAMANPSAQAVVAVVIRFAKVS
jgi:hypothetical protein